MGGLTITIVAVCCIVISKSLLKQIEENIKLNKSFSVFKKSSAFSLGMEGWCDNSDDEFKPPRAKVPRKSRGKCFRFALLDNRQAEKTVQGCHSEELMLSQDILRKSRDSVLYYSVKYYQEYKGARGGHCTTVVWDGMPEGNTGQLCSTVCHHTFSINESQYLVQVCTI